MTTTGGLYIEGVLSYKTTTTLSMITTPTNDSIRHTLTSMKTYTAKAIKAVMFCKATRVSDQRKHIHSNDALFLEIVLYS